MASLFWHRTAWKCIFAMDEILNFCRENGVEIIVREFQSIGYDYYEIRMSKGDKHVSRIVSLEFLLAVDNEVFSMVLLTEMLDELLESGERKEN